MATLKRTKAKIDDGRVILYALYKFAEATDGWYQFNLTRLMNETDSAGVSPTKIFGTEREDIERLLNGFSTNYPEINESSIKDPKNKWQSTFPHGDIVELLKFLERALSRSDKKSLWLEGSYGTGKSRIVWMIQNLLSCPETDFDAYFDEYDNLRGEIDLRERLRTLRNGKIVTACRYATSDITSTQNQEKRLQIRRRENFARQNR